jgi:carbonic anhydrase
MDILRPGYAAVAGLPEADQIAALEREAVVVSLGNLVTFPFVAEAIAGERLTLHGLWNDIGEGGLEQFDAGRGVFLPI